jgi:nucleotide-binding universal stress UspA family protein
MVWFRIMAPLSGGEADAGVCRAAMSLAAAFDAELALVHAPADVADLMPWIGDGFMGGVQASAIDSIRDAAAAGEKSAHTVADRLGYAKTTFTSLTSPVWSALAMEGRLSDVVVFDGYAAKGKGPLAEAFQQIVADEQRPTIVARGEINPSGIVAVAWDGGKEASRAMRTSLPLLQKASEVVVLSASGATSRKFDPARLLQFLEARNVKARLQQVEGHGDAGPLLLSAVRAAGAYLMVAGAFGHPRLQEYIFGGTTRSLLNAEGPSLFLSH